VIYESLGFSLQKQKRLEEAITTYEKAMAIKPSSGVQTLMDTCTENIRIRIENAGMDQEEAASKAAAEQAEREFAEAKAKEAEWKKKREQN